MELYAHWLDGEFVRIATNSVGPKQSVERFVQALKVHALLGTQFVLSDMQLVDSAVTQELFSDPEFCEFVQQDRNFIDLRIDPDPSLGTHAFALAARGLTRTQNTGWTSSVFCDDATPIKRLADEIVSEIQLHESIDLEDNSATVRKYPEFEKQLNAIRQAVYYFGRLDEAKRLEMPIAKRWNYFEILVKTFDEIGEAIKRNDDLIDMQSDFGRLWMRAAQIDQANISETILFIKKHVPASGWPYRSQVLAILDKEPDLIRRIMFWNNVVQAWNYAMELNLQPDGGSSSGLVGAGSPASYFGSIADALVPVETAIQAAPTKNAMRPLSVPVDLSSLTWKEIARARMHTAKSMGELSNIRKFTPGETEAMDEALRSHTEALGLYLKPPLTVSKSKYLWFLAKGIGVYFSSDGLPAKIIGALSVVGDSAYEGRPAYMQRLQRNALTSTLLNVAAPLKK